MALSTPFLVTFEKKLSVFLFQFFYEAKEGIEQCKNTIISKSSTYKMYFKYQK